VSDGTENLNPELKLKTTTLNCEGVRRTRDLRPASRNTKHETETLKPKLYRCASDFYHCMADGTENLNPTLKLKTTTLHCSGVRRRTTTAWPTAHPTTENLNLKLKLKT